MNKPIEQTAPCDVHVDLGIELRRHHELTLGREDVGESHHYLYHALALTLRDQLVRRWRETRIRHRQDSSRRVHYLSLEYLMGRSLNNALLNLDLEQPVRDALQQYACDLELVADEELDAGLGNGGLGRLAACFLDSCASLDIPVTGYGIRYRYGMFHQKIRDGYQIEQPDNWLRNGNPWEIECPENMRRIAFYGHCERVEDGADHQRSRWVGTQDVLAVPYDVPIPGFRNGTVNTLRLWKAEATDEFDLEEFNAGSYTDAVAAKNLAEQITMVLYPNDASELGKELRLRQQYFLASASLQDVMDHWIKRNGHDFSGFADGNCFQLNDTHPTVAVAELMRLLLDEQGLDWDTAWQITTRTMCYTNHTLLPEALEAWSVGLMSHLLPRILEIIYQINDWFLARVEEKWPGDLERKRHMSIIEEGEQPRVRMAYLHILPHKRHSGLADQHTELLQAGLFRDFHELWPSRFNNKTNGVTPRRWLAHCNPRLAELISGKLGDGWVTDLDQLEGLKAQLDDTAFADQWMAVKKHNKLALAGLVARECLVDFDANMMFDVQVKRIHEYKRQLLNILHVIHLYDRIDRGDTSGFQPRCVLFGGKAAPGYVMAKLIVKLINNVVEIVNADERARDWLRVAFLPDYRVTAMEVICPGTDLSEQISTAGKEASGTGNMKFMMNGALTIGTLDGANIEIRDAVGEENFFLFGLTAEQVEVMKAEYDPDAVIKADADLTRVMNLLEQGRFNRAEPGIFDPVIAAIRSAHDPWLTAADFRSYVKAQQQASDAYRNRALWARISILNTASSGRFSSDRTIGEYRDQIWYNPGSGAEK